MLKKWRDEIAAFGQRSLSPRSQVTPDEKIVA
jgi:hypothetical protein